MSTCFCKLNYSSLEGSSVHLFNLRRCYIELKKTLTPFKFLSAKNEVKIARENCIISSRKPQQL